MLDEFGKRIKEASPSRPVQVQGLTSVPGAGDTFLVIDAQHFAEIGRAMAEDRQILAHALLQQAEHQRFR